MDVIDSIGYREGCERRNRLGGGGRIDENTICLE